MYRVALLAVLGLFLLNLKSFGVVRLGVKGGANTTNISPAPYQDEYSAKTGVIAGGAVEATIDQARLWAFRGELLYAQKGVVYSASYFYYKRSYSEEEIDVAPFLTYRLTVVSAALFLEGGPEFGYNTRYDFGSGLSNSFSRTISQRFNLSVNFGGGLMIPIGTQAISVDARYNVGLSKVMLQSDGDAPDLSGKTNCVQVLFGYYFYTF
jgi:hypothetical protein